jgi:hypothetical protein
MTVIVAKRPGALRAAGIAVAGFPAAGTILPSWGAAVLRPYMRMCGLPEVSGKTVSVGWFFFGAGRMPALPVRGVLRGGWKVAGPSLLRVNRSAYATRGTKQNAPEAG